MDELLEKNMEQLKDHEERIRSLEKIVTESVVHLEQIASNTRWAVRAAVGGGIAWIVNVLSHMGKL